MRLSIFTNVALSIVPFVSVPGSHALPRWMEDLRANAAYAPAPYNPDSGVASRGYGGYTYLGYGPQPTLVRSTASPSSTSETSKVSTVSSSAEVCGFPPLDMFGPCLRDAHICSFHG
jgi:hypothetical protein